MKRAPRAPALLVLLALEGCFITSFEPRARLSAEPAQDLRTEGGFVSVAPRGRLERLGSALHERRSDLVPLDGLLVRDALYPEGGWALEDLPAPALRPRIEALELDALVLLENLEVGPPFAHGLPLSSGTRVSPTRMLQRSDTRATLLDARRGTIVAAMNVRAAGQSSAGVTPLGAFVEVARPEVDADRCLVDELARRLPELRHGGPVRFAILAIERPHPALYRQPLELRAFEPRR